MNRKIVCSRWILLFVLNLSILLESLFMAPLLLFLIKKRYSPPLEGGCPSEMMAEPSRIASNSYFTIKHSAYSSPFFSLKHIIVVQQEYYGVGGRNLRLVFPPSFISLQRETIFRLRETFSGLVLVEG